MDAAQDPIARAVEAAKAHYAHATGREQKQQGVTAPEAPAGKGVTTQEEPPASEGQRTAEPTRQDAQTPQSEPEARVPYDRFKSVNDENKTLKAEMERLRGELQSRQQQEREQLRERAFEHVLGSERPKGFDDWSPDKQNAWLADKVSATHVDAAMPADLQDELKQALAESKVRKKVPGLDESQVEAVARILREFGQKISPDESLALAQARHPDLFAKPAEQPQADAASQTPEAESPRMPAHLSSRNPGRAVPQSRTPSSDRQVSRQAIFEASTYEEKLGLAGQYLRQITQGQ